MNEEVVKAINEFGFPIIAAFGLGYFVYYVWSTVTKTVEPAISEMQKTIIRLTDQLRLLDQDMIRLQQKVNTVLQLKEQELTNDSKKEKMESK